MELAPIIVFAYDRPDHLSQTLAALSQNELAHDSVLYIYCDGPKDSATDDVCARIRSVREVAKQQTWPKELHVMESKHNRGLAANIIGGVTDIVNRYGRVIVFEDDIVCSKGTLTYLNDALELYKEDENVMHISAYMYPHWQPLPTTFFYDSPYPAGGWATWARAWKHFSNDTEELVAYWSKDWNSFNVMGQDFLQKQLMMNLDGRLNTWFVKWYASMHRLGGLCLYPGKSMSNNIGWDNTGVTSYSTNRYYIKKLAEYTSVRRVPIRRNLMAYHIVRVWYSGHWYSKRYRVQWLNAIKSRLRLK